MPVVQLSAEAQSRIARESRALWENFMVYHDGKYAPRNVFKHGVMFNHSVNETLLEFFNFCAQILIKDPVRETEIWWEDLGDLRDEEDDNRAISWLAVEWLEDKQVRITIILDYKCLIEEVPPALPQSLRSKLVLHEIGHLFHYDNLFHRTGGERYPLVREAESIHEAEAWWFCYCVLGLLVAECAYEKKKDPKKSGLPPVWKLIQMRVSD